MANRNQKRKHLENILNVMFQKLREAVGQRVKVYYVYYGFPHSGNCTLTGIEDYVGIKIDDSYDILVSNIPFIGYDFAIQSVTYKKRNVLYNNPYIPDNYDGRDQIKRELLVAQSFGLDIADKMRKERIKSDKEYKNRKREADALARSKTGYFIEEGRSLVRDGTLQEWKAYVRNCTQQSYYSTRAVEAALRAMQALSDGKSPEEAVNATDELGINENIANCMANAVSRFHPRGDEFRKYWNSI